ncbi:hypothetical protein ACFPTY_00500 [Halomonas beimenensis]|uniref:Uncharacterized protein n=1 Tax=Halomonas beimenensis TaxID=475662 RepID=A0A291P3I6_9GAMM|nr:hypothetical protein [Halomonas beimenensis]ATJ81430.1 hypothetical protein BEI_0443 [Halomonas beimenensis]
MITFRTVTDSLGTVTFFQVEGREAGYIDQNRHTGTWTVFFADMADAPAGVFLERSTAPGILGVFAPGLTSREVALSLVRRAYAPAATASPRSVPAPLARHVAPLLLSRPAGTTERAPFFDAASSPAQQGFGSGVKTSAQDLLPRLRTETNLRFVRVVARQPKGVSA